jgi:putative ABC transport system ATP-binding protein
LRGVSFSLDPGEVVALSGPSGSGKSTLLLCLAGILKPDRGEVLFKQRPLSEMTEAERSKLRRTEFGVLFQFGQLVPELTAAENLALPLLLHGVHRREALLRAADWLDRVGVADVISKRPTHMSGGQAQRVALARALVTDPVVLFADEPTGALDHAAGQLVLTHMTRAAAESGTAIVLVTHDRHVAGIADREVTLEDGAVTSGG